ncbi:MAG: FMN-binding protein [Erysipelotrichaceae bacterium]
MANKSTGFVKITALLVVCIAVMFVVNLLCAPIIEKNNASSKFEPLLQVMPEATDFEVLFDAESGQSSLNEVSDKVVAVYKETSGLGYVVLLSTTEGFTHEPITFTLAFSPEGVITNVALTSYPESRDFGKDYPATYIGSDSAMANVSLVAGVTYSSSAFKNATVDAFNVLIANDLIKAGQKGADQILTELLPTVFGSMVTPNGVGQYEEFEVASTTLYKGFKALNDGGYAFLAKDGDDSILALVNTSCDVKLYDVDGNDVTDAHPAVVSEAKAYCADKIVKTDGSKTISKLADATAEEISLNGVFNSVVSSYKAGSNYGFVVKTYGYGNEVMTSYFIIDNSGKIVKMSVAEIILHSEYFDAYTLDEPSYQAGFAGLDTNSYTSEVSLISGATVSSNAIDMAAKAAFEAFAVIGG